MIFVPFFVFLKKEFSKNLSYTENIQIMYNEAL